MTACDSGSVPPEQPAEPFFIHLPGHRPRRQKNGASCGAPFVWLGHTHQDT
jgi:hypothetical protein